MEGGGMYQDGMGSDGGGYDENGSGQIGYGWVDGSGTRRTWNGQFDLFKGLDWMGCMHPVRRR